MILLTNFFEVMGVVFTFILAVIFAFVLWGFFKVRNEMKDNTKPVNPDRPEHRR